VLFIILAKYLIGYQNSPTSLRKCLEGDEGILS